MNKELIEISVVIPIYNKAKYLERCLQSLKNQTFKNFEVLMIDDGSIDNSQKICKRYKEIDNRFIYIYQENYGVSVARNKGIDEAKGEWISFIDSDDWVEEDFFEKLLLKKDDDVDIIMGAAKLNYLKKIKNCKILLQDKVYNNQDYIELAKNIICRQVEKGNKCEITIGAPWAKLYKKEFLILNNIRFIPNLKRMQDSVFNLYCFKAAKKIIYFNYFGYNYRLNNGSACYAYNKEIFNIFNKAINEFIKFNRELCDNKLSFEIELRTILLFIEGMRISIVHKSNKQKLHNKVKQIKEQYYGSIYEETIKKIKLRKLGFRIKLFVILCRMHCFYGILFLTLLVDRLKTRRQE